MSKFCYYFKSSAAIYFLLIFSFCFSINHMYAQTNSAVTGTVTDSLNQPLPLVSVMVKGSKTATTTDAQGNFSINASSSSTLVFSYVGFNSQQIKLSGETKITVQLKQNSNSLGEWGGTP